MDLLAKENTGLPDIAVGYALRNSLSNGMPLVVGFSHPDEVHESVRIWRHLQTPNDRQKLEQRIREMYVEKNMLDWSWPSP